jgi:hypothetical protein
MIKTGQISFEIGCNLWVFGKWRAGRGVDVLSGGDSVAQHR